MTIVATFNRNNERVMFSDSRMSYNRECRIYVDNSQKLYNHKDILLGLCGSSYLTMKFSLLLEESPNIMEPEDFQKLSHSNFTRLLKKTRENCEPFKTEVASILAVLPGYAPITFNFEVVNNIPYQQHIVNSRNTFVAVGSGKIPASCLFDYITSSSPNISNRQLAEEILKNTSRYEIGVGGELQYIAVKETL